MQYFAMLNPRCIRSILRKEVWAGTLISSHCQLKEIGGRPHEVDATAIDSNPVYDKFRTIRIALKAGSAVAGNVSAKSLCADTLVDLARRLSVREDVFDRWVWREKYS